MESLLAQYHVHPIVDHFTIALCATGVLVDVVGQLLLTTLGGKSQFVKKLGERLAGASIILLIPGALSAILSRLTGESEAERVWETTSPAAQQILLSENGARWFFSHAELGTYLMYALLALAVWRLLLELGTRFQRTRPVYLAAAVVVLAALLYQGRTGGELVYDHGVGMNATAADRTGE